VNLSKLRGALGRNKVALGAAGAGVAVVLGLRARSKGASAAGVAGPQYPSTYGSAASDVYDMVQPQVEAAQRLVDSSRAHTDAELAAINDRVTRLTDVLGSLNPANQPFPSSAAAPAPAAVRVPAIAPSPTGLVSWTDPNVALWYKMGFPDEPSYDAVYNKPKAPPTPPFRPPTTPGGWADRARAALAR
jgi:hypothetical protein